MKTTTTLFATFITAFIPASASFAQFDAAVPPGVAEPCDVLLLAGEAVPPEVVFIQTEAPDSPNTTWLGIEVHPVPPPLAAHLATGSDGLVIGNIFKNGPADKAGLQRHDVLLEINGRKVTADIKDFMQYVKQLAPGDSVRITCLRGGAKKEVTLQAGRRPDNFEMKYPPEAGNEPYDFRGRILRRGPEGWIVDDLGPVPAPGEFPKRLRMYADKLWEKPLPPPPGELPEARHVTQEGHVLVVQRKPDGKIEVKRYEQQNGEKSAEVKVYADLKELENADRQAAELLKDAESHRLPGEADRLYETSAKLYREQMERYHRMMEDFDRQMDQYQKELRDWRERFDRYVHENRWDDRWNQWRDRFFQGPLEGMKPPTSQPVTRPCPKPQMAPVPPAKVLVPRIEPVPPGPQRPLKPLPPGVRFETKPDGSITVHIRHKDAEGSRSYPSEKALQEQAPKLYQQYQELQREFR